MLQVFGQGHRNLTLILSSALLGLLMSCDLQAAPLVSGLPDFTELVEKTSPSVVKIQTEYTGKNNLSQRGADQQMQPIPDQQIPDIIRRFFGDDPRFYPQQPFGGRPDNRREYEQPLYQAMGSGFVVAADGYILTNNHVVENADKITVNLSDGSEYTATLVGTDPRSDLALIKIDAKNLPAVSFSKTNPKVGEWVLAIGSPYGFDYSVSAGIVSAVGRSLQSAENERNTPGENYIPYIQTDVAINPGNSGGPLFNLSGEVVGINARVQSHTGGYEGLSFAIPSSLAVSVVAQLKDKGFVSRGWLGISIQDVDKDLASSFGLDKPQGALVAQLVPNSPSQGLLQDGDIILSFNGGDIKRSGDLPHLVGAAAAGTSATLKVLRDRKEKMITIKLGELPDDSLQAANATPRLSGASPADANVLGLVVETVEAQARRELGINGGVVVREVIQGSPADATGLIPGDVITQLGLVAINNDLDFKKQSTALQKGSPQAIRFFRHGQPVFRTILIQ